MNINIQDCLPDSWWKIAKCVDRYEAECGEGFPDLRELARDSAPEDFAIALAELAAVDMEFRWKASEPKTVEQYLDQDPELAGDQSFVRELIAQECQCRRRSGEDPAIGDFRRRFPAYDLSAQSLDLSRSTLGMRGSTFNVRVESNGAIPKKFGKYRVIEEIGSGGFGRVFRCRDDKLNRDVAVKLPRNLTSHATDDNAAFIHEARTVAELRHQGIVSVLDADELENGQVYVVYEYVAGTTLRDRVREGRYTREEAVAWCIGIAEALNYTHRHKIVHRDVSAANVLIDDEGKTRTTVAMARGHTSGRGRADYSDRDSPRSLPTDSTSRRHAGLVRRHGEFIVAGHGG